MVVAASDNMTRQTPIEKFKDAYRTKMGCELKVDARCKCPAHADASPSFSIRVKSDNSVSPKCFAGCEYYAILKALDLKARDCYPQEPSTQGDKRKQPNFRDLTNRNSQALTELLEHDFAESLGLPVDALTLATVHGYDGEVFTHTETDAKGNPIGIVRRTKPKKVCVTGSKRGLYIPKGWQDKEGSVFLVEGFSDTATTNYAGMKVIGRPSNEGGVLLLAEVLKSLPVDCPIIFVGENDKKENGLHPGLDGAMKSATELSKLLQRSVSYALVPAGSKDSREWLTSPDRGDMTWEQRGKELRAKLMVDAIAIDPEPGLPIEPKPVVISNYRTEWTEPEEVAEGKKPKKQKEIHIGICAEEIQKQIVDGTGGWPKRAAGYLFANENDSVLYLPESTDTFAWLNGAVRTRDGLNPIHWGKGDDKITQAQMHGFLRNNVERYAFVEGYPHFPSVPNHFYLHPKLPKSVGTHLQKLVTFFCPATDIDRDLIMSFLMTLVAGGNPGQRPAFLFTAEDGEPGGGRGIGKTTTVKVCSRLVGGHMEYSTHESGDAFKTRLLSPSGLAFRVVLIDNIKSSKFSSADIEAMITADTISGKALYIGEGRRPNHLVWCLTINGACLSKDLANRCIIIKLKRPEYQGNWESEVAQYVEKHRWDIIADLLAMLQLPSGDVSTDTRWAAWERLVLSKVQDPIGCQKLIVERQTDVDGDSEEMELVRNEFIEQIRHAGRDPDYDVLNIPSKMTAVWYGTATQQPGIQTGKATTMIKALAIREITPFRHNDARGFTWRGRHSRPGQPPTNLY